MQWDLIASIVRNNANSDLVQVSDQNDPQDLLKSDEAETAESDKGASFADTIDDITVEVCGESKSIYRVDHTLLLGYGLKAGNKKPNINDLLDLKSLDRYSYVFQKMQ